MGNEVGFSAPSHAWWEPDGYDIKLGFCIHVIKLRDGHDESDSDGPPDDSDELDDETSESISWEGSSDEETTGLISWPGMPSPATLVSKEGESSEEESGGEGDARGGGAAGGGENSQNVEWPRRKYCIIQVGDLCPRGLVSGQY